MPMGSAHEGKNESTFSKNFLGSAHLWAAHIFKKWAAAHKWALPIMGSAHFAAHQSFNPFTLPMLPITLGMRHT